MPVVSPQLVSDRRRRPLPIRLVAVDLAGTTVDFGSRAPAGVFVELFARHGIGLSDGEARGPMGTAKRDHIAALAALPRVAEAWRLAHAGAAFSEADLDALYAEFIPLQLESLPAYSELIPGTRDVVAALRGRGVRVAATTGYDTAMTRVVIDRAAPQGFVPDAVVCASDVAAGRPAPWMIFRAMERTGVWPAGSVVAVGDTIADIEAAVNAGVVAVGVVATGNMVGLSLEEWAAMPAAGREARLAAGRSALFAAGADAVLDGIDELPALIASLDGGD